MIFIYRTWEVFCKTLQEQERLSIPACEVHADMASFLVLKHDVETDVAKAYQLAVIEHRYGHRGSYYVQAYLMKDAANIQLLKKMQGMGHEISYHYDVMDSCHGNLNSAIAEFTRNKELFEENGFRIVTVCQHGNPVVERVGYTSNRDFFRSSEVQSLFPQIKDIMVNFASGVPTEYQYFSDAGRKFKLIYDPINNDRVPSDDKNIAYDDLNDVLAALRDDRGNIISTHPHRWAKSAMAYQAKAFAFKAIKGTAKQLVRIPMLKKLMSRYYYLAKKI